MRKRLASAFALFAVLCLFSLPKHSMCHQSEEQNAEEMGREEEAKDGEEEEAEDGTMPNGSDGTGQSGSGGRGAKRWPNLGNGPRKHSSVVSITRLLRPKMPKVDEKIMAKEKPKTVKKIESMEIKKEKKKLIIGIEPKIIKVKKENEIKTEPMEIKIEHNIKSEDEKEANYERAKNELKNKGIGRTKKHLNDLNCGKTKKYSNKTKQKIVEKLLELKEKLKGKASQRKLDEKFAKKVGRDITTIYRWKDKLGLTAKRSREYSAREKKEIIGEFIRLKEQFSNGKSAEKRSAREIDAKVTETLGLSIATIYLWRRKLGMTSPFAPRKSYSFNDKMEIVRQYGEIKAETPHLRLKHIAQMMDVPERTLCNIRKELSTERNPQKMNKRSIYVEFGIKEKECVKCGHVFPTLRANNVKRHLGRHHKKLFEQIEGEKAKRTKFDKMLTAGDGVNDYDDGRGEAAKSAIKLNKKCKNAAEIEALERRKKGDLTSD